MVAPAVDGNEKFNAKKNNKPARSGNNVTGFCSFGSTLFLVSVSCKVIPDGLTFLGNMIRVSLKRILSHTNRY